MISDCLHTIRLEFGDGRENDLHKLDVLLTMLSGFREVARPPLQRGAVVSDLETAETADRRPAAESAASCREG